MKKNKEKATENPLISVIQLPLGRDKSHDLMETGNMPVRFPVDVLKARSGSDDRWRSLCLTPHGMEAGVEHMKTAEFLCSKTLVTSDKIILSHTSEKFAKSSYARTDLNLLSYNFAVCNHVTHAGFEPRTYNTQPYSVWLATDTCLFPKKNCLGNT